jgi:hypothetical protein
MATKRSKPSTSLAQLHERLDRVTGDGTCVALILPLIGLGMRCTRPCARCRALAAEVERLRPEWERVRDARERGNKAAPNPGAAGTPVVPRSLPHAGPTVTDRT